MRTTTRALSDRHEAHLAEVLGARRTPGSGNGFANPMDVRQNRYDGIAFAIDGKATLAASVSVTREMWTKAVEQAHGERPGVALRFYDDDRLTHALDLVVISLDDFAELLDIARRTQ